MNRVTSRLDLILALVVGVAVTAALWRAWGTVPAMIGGAGGLAVVALAATCLRLVQALEAASTSERSAGPENAVEQPSQSAEESDGDPGALEFLSWAEQLTSELRDGYRGTADFRRGLIGELALSFDDVQARLEQLNHSVDKMAGSAVPSMLPTGDATDAESAVSLVAAQLEAVRRDIVGLKHEVRGIPRSNDLLHQIEAIVTLRGMVREIPLPLPVSGGWRASPTTLLRYLELLGARDSQLVVECGSGVSSVWVGHRLRQLGGGRCVALEHDPEFFEESCALVASHGLDDLVEVRLAPLTDGPAPWYDRAAIEDLHDVDVLFVDGPPGPTGPQARGPALEALGSRMRVGGHLLIDDSDRDDETVVIDGWLQTGLVRLAESSTDYKGWTLLEYVGPQG